MRHACLTAVTLLVALAVTAAADTVFLANEGKVVGKITEVRLKIGPLEKTLAAAQIASVKCTDTSCAITDTEGTRFVGTIDSVSIRCVAGFLTFADKSVRSIQLGEETKVKPDEKIEPAPNPEPVGDPGIRVPVPKERKTLTPEEIKHLAQLLKTAASIRDEYLKKADDLTTGDYAAVKDKYGAKWDTVCAKVEERKKDFAKYAKDLVIDSGDTKPSFSGTGTGLGISRTTTVFKSGAAAGAYQALEDAEAEKAQVASAIKSAKGVVASRERFRRDRINAYFEAVARYLANGKDIPEADIRKIFDKTLAAK